MKRILSLLLALTMLISLFPVLASAADLTPGDFGWNTDGNNFDGWTVDETGSTYTVSYNGSNSKRIWKELLSDPQNFTLSFDVQIHNKRIELEILGLKLELNTGISPCVIVPTEGEENFIYMVLPILLRQ